jgi:hypothetical protein
MPPAINTIRRSAGSTRLVGCGLDMGSKARGALPPWTPRWA